MNLYELLKQNQFRGLSTQLLRLFLGQLLEALCALRRVGIIHCDLKPENVLLTSLHSGELKLIDLGSACADGRTVYTYIQSRFYRAPEVVLGAPYGAPIDMWSLGCLAAELFLGLPIFPGASEYNLLQRITEALGPPPEGLMAGAKHAARFFARAPGGGWALQTPAEHEALTGTAPALGKRYFAATTLPGLVQGAPLRRGLSEQEALREAAQRVALLDWLQGCLELDPAARWTPLQAAAHPFITGAPLLAPWRPPHEHGGGVRRAGPVPPAFHIGSPQPSPRSAAAAAWPGGALPVAAPHSLHDPSPLGGAPGASLPDQYAALMASRHAQLRAQAAALYGAPAPAPVPIAAASLPPQSAFAPRSWVGPAVRGSPLAAASAAPFVVGTAPSNMFGGGGFVLASQGSSAGAQLPPPPLQGGSPRATRRRCASVCWPEIVRCLTPGWHNFLAGRLRAACRSSPPPCARQKPAGAAAASGRGTWSRRWRRRRPPRRRWRRCRRPRRRRRGRTSLRSSAQSAPLSGRGLCSELIAAQTQLPSFVESSCWFFERIGARWCARARVHYYACVTVLHRTYIPSTHARVQQQSFSVQSKSPFSLSCPFC